MSEGRVMYDKERALWEELANVQRNRIDDLLERIAIYETALDTAWEIVKICMQQEGARVMDLNEFFYIVEKVHEEEDR